MLPIVTIRTKRIRFIYEKVRIVFIGGSVKWFMIAVQVRFIADHLLSVSRRFRVALILFTPGPIWGISIGHPFERFRNSGLFSFFAVHHYQPLSIFLASPISHTLLR